MFGAPCVAVGIFDAAAVFCVDDALVDAAVFRVAVVDRVVD